MKHRCCKHSTHEPSQKDKDGTNQHEISNTKFVNEVTGHRHRPCFKQDKQGVNKGDFRIRDRGKLLLESGRKQRKCILKVRYNDHRNDASSQLYPPVTDDGAIGLLGQIQRGNVVR